MNGPRGRRLRAAVVVVGVALPVVGACGPPPPVPAITVADIGDLGTGRTRPHDIDDGGRVVGESGSSEGGLAPFSWEDGTITRLVGPTVEAMATAVDGDLVAGAPIADTQWEVDPAYVWEGDGPSVDLALQEDRPVPVAVVGGKVLLASDFQYGQQAILWEGGESARPPTLPGGAMDGGDVNAEGVVVGRSTRYADEPYTWSEAAGLTALPTIGGTYGESHAVNDAGQVAGWATTAGDAAQHAVLWAGGQATDLGTLGGPTSNVTGGRSLSEAGHVVGTSTTADGESHAFLWHDGEMTDLGTLGGAMSRPTAVNSHGQVVGVSETADGAQHAFLWEDGAMTDLTALAPAVDNVVDINEAGQAIGYALDGSRAVVWTAPPG